MVFIVIGGIGRTDLLTGSLVTMLALAGIESIRSYAEHRIFTLYFVYAYPDTVFVRTQQYSILLFTGHFAGLAVYAVFIIESHSISSHDYTFLISTFVSCMAAPP
jgi:hypothetical protein